MPLPNALYIGPDKAGSTWLYEYFRAHHEVSVTPAKDIYFFDRYYGNGLHWYSSQFSGGAKIVAEVCHDYLYSKVAAERIRRDLPGVKLLLFLRCPIERAWSHYLFLRRSAITSDDFMTAVTAYPDIVERSKYARHLREYVVLFDSEQIGLFDFAELKMCPTCFVSHLCDFLRIEPLDPFTNPGFVRARGAVRVAAVPRSFLLTKLAKRSAQLLRRAGQPKLLGRLKRGRVANTLFKTLPRASAESIPPEVEQFLRDALCEDVAALREMVPEVARFGPWRL